jgi:poly(3-hydroxybutyrate) depolymerase
MTTLKVPRVGARRFSSDRYVNAMKGSTCLSLILAFGGAGAGQDSGETPVVIESDGWRLAGDLRLPEDAGKPVPAVVLLHGAARNRVAYTELGRLASRASRPWARGRSAELPPRSDGAGLGA